MPLRLPVFLIFSLIVFNTHAQLNISFLSQLNYPESMSNLWGWTSPGGEEYVILGTYYGTRIIDVSNPGTPEELFFIDGTNSSWREVKTQGDFAYVVTEGGDGLLCIDLSELPDDITYNFSDGGIGLSSAHTVNCDEFGYIHVFGSDFAGGGDLILNANTDPLDPVYAGEVDEWYIHDGFVRGDTLWAANIYEGQFSIWDISDKTTPVLLGTQSTPKNFTHNTALSDDGNYLFTTDETSNASVACYDVSDPADINLLDEFRSIPGSNSIPHNTYVRGDFLVTAWYRDGVVITDKLHPELMIKTGYYDTSPVFGGSGFNGAWGVYPYFPSGIIAVSDIENGLYLLQPTYVHACYLEGNVTDEITGADLFGVNVSIVEETLAATTTDISGNYITAVQNAGTYTISFSKTGYLTETFSGVNLTTGGTTVLNVTLETVTATCVAPVTLYETSITASSAILHWNNVGATSYTVTYKKNGGAAINVNVTANQIALTGLESCSNYKWRVKAKCPDGSKPVSALKSFNTPAVECGREGDNEIVGFDDPSFELYPNPAGDHLFIEYANNNNRRNEGFLSSIQLKIIDMSGRIVLEKEINENIEFIELDISHLVKAMYILSIQSANGVEIEKFIKE
ncbi:MAG: choice-of-anchor B family protein [Chitinophagales bacterium]|nr:choice-of-anchor B family protein [Chitinophagales bacterium]